MDMVPWYLLQLWYQRCLNYGTFGKSSDRFLKVTLKDTTHQMSLQTLEVMSHESTTGTSPISCFSSAQRLTSLRTIRGILNPVGCRNNCVHVVSYVFCHVLCMEMTI